MLTKTQLPSKVSVPAFNLLWIWQEQKEDMPAEEGDICDVLWKFYVQLEHGDKHIAQEVRVEVISFDTIDFSFK